MNRRWAAVVAILIVHVVLLVDGARRDVLTFDEPSFMGAGVAAWERGDYRFAPDGGILPERLQGLALILGGVHLQPNESAWQRSDGYEVGGDLVYHSGVPPGRVLLLARLPTMVLAVMLGLLVHHVARQLLGDGCALAALALYASCPIILANGRLATADIGAALALLLASWLAAQCLARVTWRSVIASCAATSLAFVAKYSAVLLLPIVLACVLAHLLARKPVLVGGRHVDSNAGKAGVIAVLVALHALAAVGVIWLAHGGRYAACAPGEAPAEFKSGGWATVEHRGVTAPFVALAREHQLLPEAWLFGFQFTVAHAEARPSFAAGRWSSHGFPWFFPYALSLKLPLATLALLALGLLAFLDAWRRGRSVLRADGEPVTGDARPLQAAARDMLIALPLMSLFVILGAAAASSGLNIGVRHVMPLLPVMFIVASTAWKLAPNGSRARTLVGALFVLAAAEGVSSHPDHLSWMNTVAGPPASRWQRLTDSSLDWGQGLSELAKRLPSLRRDGETAYLAYFGTADPIAAGVEAEALSSCPYRWSRRVETPLQGGLYCVSATQLVQVWSQACPGPWSDAWERAWTDVRPRARAFFAADPATKEALIQGQGAAEWSRTVQLYEQLALGRLCSFLRRREPDACVDGGSILAFRLTDDEVAQALDGAPVELVRGAPPLASVPFSKSTR